jgi:hypothetical protein
MIFPATNFHKNHGFLKGGDMTIPQAMEFPSHVT